jgi:FkbM family methyltransferase
MRRLFVIFYWLFKSRNNVGLKEMIGFLLKPKVQAIAGTFIRNIVKEKDFHVISLNDLKYPLYWPGAYPVSGIYQVVTETFDKHDWHYYQKDHTKVSANDVLLDVGAAEGLFALTVVDICKQVFLVEPNDHFVNALQKTFAGHQQKVTIFNVAVGEQEGVISFDENSLSGKIEEGRSDKSSKRVATIDNLLPAGTRITYLKADVEGYELKMLKGAGKTISSNKPKIVVTSYHTENDHKEIVSFIKGLVPEYNHYVKGIFHEEGKPVMIHFWI